MRRMGWFLGIFPSGVEPMNGGGRVVLPKAVVHRFLHALVFSDHELIRCLSTPFFNTLLIEGAH